MDTPGARLTAGGGLRIVAAGYYGCGNLGDDALLMGLLKGVGTRHEVVALSGDPAATTAAFGIPAVPRKDIKRATQSVKDADALVFGGGGLLQDTTSLLSLKYYTHLIETAAKSGKRIALLGQGIGPIRSVFGKRAASRAFSQCDLITTRDEGSMRLVERLAGSCKARKAVTDDLAWLAIEGDARVDTTKAIAISARPWKEATGRIIGAYREFCERAAGEGWEIVPVSFDRGMDDSVLSAIAPGGTFAESPQGALAALGKVQAVVAMRLHAGIFSAGLGIVPTMVSYDDKVTAFAESFGGQALLLKDLSGQSLWDHFRHTLDNLPRLQPAIKERAELGAIRARTNVTMLEEILAVGTA